ncbi:hypothetical protein [Nostoc sp. UHCC 0302]|uniref:hypothetical protein n=1 Tax=Nostoc sp. UHCC 0302 TaxID=3134896 RepID=UPI00311CBBCF
MHFSYRPSVCGDLRIAFLKVPVVVSFHRPEYGFVYSCDRFQDCKRAHRTLL